MTRPKKSKSLAKDRLRKGRDASIVSSEEKNCQLESDYHNEMAALRLMNIELQNTANSLKTDNDLLTLDLNAARTEVQRLEDEMRNMDNQKQESKFTTSVLEKQVKHSLGDVVSKNGFLIQLKAELKDTEKIRRKLETRVKKMRVDLDKCDETKPPPTKVRCKYDMKSSKAVKDSYCEQTLEYLKNIAGEENLDSFTTCFVHYIANDDKFSFRFSFDEKLTAYCKVRFNWSDPFMKEFKSLCKKRLGFDILSSRVKTSCLLKEVDPLNNYEIDMVETKRKSSQNKLIPVLAPVVTIRNFEKSFEK